MCSSDLFGYEDYDPPAGNYYFMSKDATTSTKTNMGFARNATDVYDVFLYARPNDSLIGVRITNVSSGTLLYDTLFTASSMPQNTVWLRPSVLMSAGSGSTSVTMDLMKVYAETPS